jgi:hypothetical protein
VHTRLPLVMVLAGAGILTACGGGSGSMTGPSQPIPAAPSEALTPLTLRIDRPASATNAVKRAQYVSPATQSLVYVITDPSGNAVTGGSGYVNLTTASNYCSSAGALQPLTCSVSLPIAIAQTGTYTFNVATYDAQQSASCTPAGTPACSGTLLSRASIGSTLTVGAANSVSLTLAGVPASIRIFPASNLTMTSGTTFSIAGAGAHPFLAQALDADGNVIVGTGAPSFTISLSGFPGTLTQPSSSSPNQFSITPPSSFTSSLGTLTATASYGTGSTDGCAQSGAVCSASATIEMRELLAFNGFNGVELVADGYRQPIQTFSGVLSKGSTFDSNGNLFSVGLAKVYEFPVPFATASPSASVANPAGSNVARVFSDASSHIFTVGSALGGTLERYPSPLAAPTTLWSNSADDGAIDSAGNAVLAAGGLVIVAPAGSAQTISNATADYQIVAVRSDDAIAAWDLSNGVIDLYTKPYGSTPNASVPFTDVVRGMAFDPSGNLYIADATASTIARIPSSFTAVSATALALPSAPWHILVTSGGSELLVVINNSLEAFSLPFSSTSQPYTTWPIPGATTFAAYP